MGLVTPENGIVTAAFRSLLRDPFTPSKRPGRPPERTMPAKTTGPTHHQDLVWHAFLSLSSAPGIPGPWGRLHAVVTCAPMGPARVLYHLWYHIISVACLCQSQAKAELGASGSSPSFASGGRFRSYGRGREVRGAPRVEQNPRRMFGKGGWPSMSPGIRRYDSFNPRLQRSRPLPCG